MKKTLQLSLIGVLLFPAVASAAWWNPLTWSWSQTQTPGTIEDISSDTDLPPADFSTTTTPIASDNSDLLAQIEELKLENKSLTNQLSVASKMCQDSVVGNAPSTPQASVISNDEQVAKNYAKVKELTLQEADLKSQKNAYSYTASKSCLTQYMYDHNAQEICLTGINAHINDLQAQIDSVGVQIVNLETGKVNVQ